MTMKIINSIASILIVCSLFSCKKETYKTRYDELLPKNSGIVTAFLNGKEWKSDICLTNYFRALEKVDTIDFTARVFENGYERQQLSISMINLLSPLQKIEPTIHYDSVNKRYYLRNVDGCNSAFFPIDVDVPENVYSVYENESTKSYVKIEEYNFDTKKVKGSFEAHYTRFSRQAPLTQGLPDTLHFTSGKFEFQLK